MSSYKTYFGTISVKDPTFGAVGNGVTDDTAAIQAAFDFAFSGGQSDPFSNHAVFFPPGNYITTAPLNILGLLGGHIYGAGNGVSQIFFKGTGAEGNSVSTENPALTPIFMMDGVGYTTVENLSFANSNITAPRFVSTVTNNSTAAGTTPGVNDTLHFASVSADIHVGMFVYDFSSTSNVEPLGSTVVSKTATTVVLSGFVGGGGVANGDTIYFATSVSGIYLYQSGNFGTSTALNVSNCNFSSMGLGIFAGANAGNCENGVVYNCQFNTCVSAGVKVFGFNTLNWQIIGGGGSLCAEASTFISGSKSGNGAAVYSALTGGITLIANPSVSGNTVDIYQGGSQSMVVMGGRSESITSVVAYSSPIEFISVQCGGGDVILGTRFLDLTFGGLAAMRGCTFAPNNLSGGTKLLAALGNSSTLILENTTFDNHADQCGISGAGSSKVFIKNITGSAIPTAATLFGSFTATGGVREYDPVNGCAVDALPTAAAKYEGLRGWVTDANATTFNSTVANGGSNIMGVRCNGSNWVIG